MQSLHTFLCTLMLCAPSSALVEYVTALLAPTAEETGKCRERPGVPSLGFG